MVVAGETTAMEEGRAVEKAERGKDKGEEDGGKWRLTGEQTGDMGSVYCPS